VRKTAQDFLGGFSFAGLDTNMKHIYYISEGREPYMKLVVISGSMREQSATRAAAQVLVRTAVERGAEVTLLDLREMSIPIFDDTPAPPQVEAMRQMVAEADGLLIGTPEYHNGMSGALKNAFDWMGAKQFKNKPVAIFAAAGGGKGGINALNNLRTVLRGVYALVLPGQVVVDEECVAADGQVTDAALVTRLGDLVAQVCEIAGALSLAKTSA
jgi:azobenzene reductase